MLNISGSVWIYRDQSCECEVTLYGSGEKQITDRVKDIWRYLRTHLEFDPGSIIRMGNRFFPRPFRHFDSPVPSILFLGETTSSDTRTHTARYMDVQELPIMGGTQYIQLRLVDLQSNSRN